MKALKCRLSVPSSGAAAPPSPAGRRAHPAKYHYHATPSLPPPAPPKTCAQQVAPAEPDDVRAPLRVRPDDEEARRGRPADDREDHHDGEDERCAQRHPVHQRHRDACECLEESDGDAQGSLCEAVIGLYTNYSSGNAARSWG